MVTRSKIRKSSYQSNDNLKHDKLLFYQKLRGEKEGGRTQIWSLMFILIVQLQERVFQNHCRISGSWTTHQGRNLKYPEPVFWRWMCDSGLAGYFLKIYKINDYIYIYIQKKKYPDKKILFNSIVNLLSTFFQPTTENIIFRGRFALKKEPDGRGIHRRDHRLDIQRYAQGLK